jgi:FtsH-binding integral membrane protein
MIVSPQKSVFMSKVFANLLFQTLVVYSTARVVIQNQNLEEGVVRSRLFISIAALLIVLALGFMRRLPVAAKFALFTVLSILLGMLFSSFKSIDKRSLQEALAGTIALFFGMLMLGFISAQFKVDLVPLYILLFIAYIVALVMSLFTHIGSKIFVPLFALFIMVETNLMLRKNFDGDFVNGSLSYFTDTINIFSQLAVSNTD